MQNYIDFAHKNGVELCDVGICQFCGTDTKRGVHECLNIFNLGFENLDFSKIENHKYRFYIVDAHTLQHPEIHGRWSNHFHLTRLHLCFEYKIDWKYEYSPRLSEFLNGYKKGHLNEIFTPPPVLHRGSITSGDILKVMNDTGACKTLIREWAKEVYRTWNRDHEKANVIASGFLSTGMR